MYRHPHSVLQRALQTKVLLVTHAVDGIYLHIFSSLHYICTIYNILVITTVFRLDLCLVIVHLDPLLTCKYLNSQYFVILVFLNLCCFVLVLEYTNTVLCEKQRPLYFLYIWKNYSYVDFDL